MRKEKKARESGQRSREEVHWEGVGTEADGRIDGRLIAY